MRKIKKQKSFSDIDDLKVISSEREVHNVGIRVKRAGLFTFNTELHYAPVPSQKLILAKALNKKTNDNKDIFIEDTLEGGSYGKIKLAMDGDGSKNYVVKIGDVIVDKPGCTKQDMLREAEIMRRFYGVGFVHFYKSNKDGREKAYIVMRNIGKIDLFDRLYYYKRYNRNPLTDEEKIKILISIAGQIQKLHQIGYLHRDIKLENILLDNKDEPCVIDFGFAIEWSGGNLDFSANKEFVGTTGYIHPEVECGIFSNKTDIFSFGMLALRLFDSNETIDYRYFVDPSHNVSANQKLKPAEWMMVHANMKSQNLFRSMVPFSMQNLIMSIFKNTYDEIPSFIEIIDVLKEVQRKREIPIYFKFLACTTDNYLNRTFTSNSAKKISDAILKLGNVYKAAVEELKQFGGTGVENMLLQERKQKLDKRHEELLAQQELPEENSVIDFSVWSKTHALSNKKSTSDQATESQTILSLTQQ